MTAERASDDRMGQGDSLAAAAEHYRRSMRTSHPATRATYYAADEARAQRELYGSPRQDVTPLGPVRQARQRDRRYRDPLGPCHPPTVKSDAPAVTSSRGV